MSRQHSTPYLVTDSTSHPLKQVEGAFNEAWLQDFVFIHSETIPIDQIEPVFGPLIPVCRELRTNAGPVDLLFVNGEGLLTLVECKLWKNPDARRQVIAQILDYAKEISSWSYEKLEQAIRDSSKEKKHSLYQLVASSSEELDESEFIDAVARNLKRGRFLLLIVGSGIRESVELLTDFLQRHAHMNFSLALVEVGIFRVPDDARTVYLILPRVVAQTVEVERAVIRVEDGRIVAVPSPEPTPGTGTKISEQAFYEKLAKIDARTANELRSFLDRAKAKGLSVQPGRNSNSLMLKFIAEDVELNLGIYRVDGSFQNRRIARLTERIGYPEIGETYLKRLASLFSDGCVFRHPNKWLWEVRKGNNQHVTIAEILAVQDKWLEIIQDTIDQLLKAQERDT